MSRQAQYAKTSAESRNSCSVKINGAGCPWPSPLRPASSLASSEPVEPVGRDKAHSSRSGLHDIRDRPPDVQTAAVRFAPSAASIALHHPGAVFRTERFRDARSRRVSWLCVSDCAFSLCMLSSPAPMYCVTYQPPPAPPPPDIPPAKPPNPPPPPPPPKPSSPAP